MQDRTELYIDFTIAQLMEYINSIKNRRTLNYER